MSNTNKQKKPSVLKRSLHYAGKKRYMLPLAMVFSALSGILVLMPMVYIHKIVSGIILSGSVDGEAIRYYAILAASFAAAGMLLYFCALMVSHLFAFEVESNIIKLSVKKMMAKPLGFFANRESGNLRKTIVDGAGETHTMLAHQLPDLAATFLVPLVAAILIFVFDWILGLACIVPVIIAMLVMGFMMNAEGRQFMKSYMTSLEEMNTEAVEYVLSLIHI